MLGEDLSGFDFVLLSDVLEHLSDPERFLVNCRYSMEGSRAPAFLISTGNVAFLGVRLLLGMGFFTYGERGILDITHKRLFTVASFRRLLKETGFTGLKIHGLGVPFRLALPNRTGAVLSRLSAFLARLWPSLFAYQIFVEARPKPNALVVLEQAERLDDGTSVPGDR